MAKILLPVLAACLFFAPSAEAAPNSRVLAASLSSSRITLAEAQQLRSAYENLVRVKALARADGRVTRAESERIKALEVRFARERSILLENKVRR